LASGSRSFSSFEDFLANIHKAGVTLTEFKGTKIPTIYVDSRRYDEIMAKTYGKKVAVDTLLNIFHDGRHVFVDVIMKFLDLDLQENYLLYANDIIEFFEALAETSLISLAPDHSSVDCSSNVFMIQLPRKEQAEKALRIILKNADNQALHEDFCDNRL
jgi:hypothetical protein